VEIQKKLTCRREGEIRQWRVRGRKENEEGEGGSD